MTTGAGLRAAREAAGLSLSRMAQRTHFAKSYLSMVETGKRAVAPDVITAYEQVLGVPLQADFGDPLRIAHEWLVAESPMVVHRRAGRQVGVSLAKALEDRVVELRHLDDVVSSRDLLPAAAKELGEAQELVGTASFSEQVGRRLFTAVGELAQLAGWIAGDAGRYADAQRTYLEGVGAAEQAGDRVLAAQLLSSLSYQLANVGNPRDAALLARTAVRGADGATPVVRALLLERVAWASVKAGDVHATWHALDAVNDSYGRRGAEGSEPEWVYWLDQGEIDVMAGRCMIELGRPHDAEPLLSHAVAQYPAEHAREVALYLTWLAESHARTGDLDAARDAVARAQHHAAIMPSIRTDTRLDAISKLL
ncbi:helix-turn-helix domain-containing protein [Saccharopolyspora flava]|uniref:Helix-turn-helix domain-containing protein n=1 Tax=Saccharopolyspora flava TaxID=95161 RepID=A0A1I6RMW6_9PSEU|nr:helix-turn-helix transcriptional regulator [Saccharopolyspora flava]SFS66032.1 Helix-turn-helix domain-containing protein [Saccharopolyspora flava]